MVISFFSNFFNHHQSNLADELYELTNGQFYFIELVPMPEVFVSNGYGMIDRPYIVRAWKDDCSKELALRLCLESDVVLFGGKESLKYQIKRARTNKLSFEVSERWFKRGFVNMFSPNLLKNMLYYHTIFRKRPFYKLCASAYAANDQYLMKSYVGKCYKWGYFTNVKTGLPVSGSIPNEDRKIRIMWCSRFIGWKHPELAIHLAKKLKDNNYSFQLDMYGSGKLLDRMIKLSNELGLEEYVKFCGTIANEGILSEMQNHDIFLMTSDQNEGWGAVVNEAMSNYCALVASNEAGSVPYLVKNNVNGKVFQSCDLDSLYECVADLIDNPSLRDIITQNAYNTISTIWSPKNAANNLIKLIECLLQNKQSPINEGPCSLALPIK